MSSDQDVSIQTLLFGIHESIDDQVLIKLEENQAILHDLKEGQLSLLEQNAQMAELLNRNFTRQWNAEMANSFRRLEPGPPFQQVPITPIW